MTYEEDYKKWDCMVKEFLKSLKERTSKPEFLERWERESYIKGWKDGGKNVLERVKKIINELWKRQHTVEVNYIRTQVNSLKKELGVK